MSIRLWLTLSRTKSISWAKPFGILWLKAPQNKQSGKHSSVLRAGVQNCPKWNVDSSDFMLHFCAIGVQTFKINKLINEWKKMPCQVWKQYVGISIFCSKGLWVAEFSIWVSKGIWSLFKHDREDDKFSLQRWRLCCLETNQLKHNAGTSSFSERVALTAMFHN